MAKDKVSDWSSTPSNNTDVGGIDINEGCAPSGINNAIREVMAQIKDMQSGLDSDNFTVGGNLSVTGTSTLTGNVTASGTLAVTGLTTATGGVAGDIYASNGTSKVLENGTDGTNATFTGAVTGNVTGTSSKATNIVGGNNTTLLGSIPYQSNTDTTTLLSPNTTTTKLYLAQTGTGTNGAAPFWTNVYELTTATVQNATTTPITFGSIPSWVKKITVMLQGITGGVGGSYIRLGTSSSIASTGYSGTHSSVTSSPNNTAPTTGIYLGSVSGTIRGGIATITNISGNTWVYTYHGSDGSTPEIDNGNISLSGTLAQLQLVFGTTPTGGSVNIMYE